MLTPTYSAGGSSADLYIGPVDPLFFPHHANIDRIWWLWQQRDLESRLQDMEGNLTPPNGFLFPGEDYSQFPNETITLDWKISVGRLAPSVETRELMDIQRGALGYRYTNPRRGMRDPMRDAAFKGRVQEFKQRWARYRKVMWGSTN